MSRRLLVVTGVSTVLILAPMRAALADPAGPTDYETSVVAITPAVPGFVVEVIGGDSFIRLKVEPGHLVEVVGYGGEPYLRFEGEVVLENRLSPTKYRNEDRYAISEVPEFASASNEPDWVEVSAEGSYTWHDHRAHWMNPAPPPGAGPGEQILEGVIPLVVDGVDVDVTVVSLWRPSPQSWPALIGVMAGIGLALMGWRRSRRPAVLFAASLAATAVALIAFLSVPAETAPSIVAWLVPVTAGGLAAWAWQDPFRSPTLLLVAAVELVIWGSTRFDWMTAAILPTDLPHWIDRLITAAVLVGATGVLFSQVRELLRELRPQPPGLDSRRTAG